MQKTLLFLAFLCISVSSANGQYTPTEAELKIATLPLPAELRDGAGVIHWDFEGQITRYVESSNGLSCNVDNPDDEIVSIRCYNDHFWPAIARSRELATVIESYEQRMVKMDEEIQSGMLSVPKMPTAGYRILDLVSGTINLSGPASPSAKKWQSIHFPFRTAEELGLRIGEEINEEGMESFVPFVMSSGNWWSHVMIVHKAFDN